jgi:poly-gamma-glutamate synthesis protein (capsule biosynthesis protein)
MIIVVLFVLLALVFFGFWSRRLLLVNNTDHALIVPVATTSSELIKPESILHLAFVGDMMLTRGLNKIVKQNSAGDYHFPFAKIAETLKGYDFVFGNLEGNISDQTKKCGSIYSFNMATSVASVLVDTNFKAVSVANNHSFDYCYKGFLQTLTNLEQAGVVSVGGGLTEYEAYSPKYVMVKDDSLKIVMLGFSAFGKGYMEALDGTGGIAITNDVNKICSSVATAKLNSDLVIVSLHFGEEYKTLPGIVERDLAEAVVDCGADLIVGHHPHVVQPLEKYNDKYIAYSLGNFIFDQNFSPETMSGAILDVTVKDKKIIEAELIPTRMNSLFQPEVVKEN